MTLMNKTKLGPLFSVKKVVNYILRLIPVLLILLAFSMTLWRAANLSIVHDEALTVNVFVPRSYAYILGLTGEINGHYPNNHPINTALIKLSTSILGTSEITVRMPALLGHLIYMVAAYYLVTFLFTKQWKRIIALSFLIFHPFLIDFFSVARGYGLSLGFLMTGITLMVKCVDKPSHKNFKFSELGLFFSALAATNNLTFIYVYLALLICHFFIILRTFHRIRLPLFIRGFVFSLIPILLVYSRNFWAVYTQGQYNVGGKGGLWIDTLPSIVRATLYRFDPSMSYQIIRIVFLIVTAVGFWVIIKKARKPVPIFLSMVFLLTTFGVYIATKIFHMESITERYAIYFIPLISLFLLSFWQSLESIPKIRFFRIILVGAIVFLIGYYISSIQFKYYYTWHYDKNSKEAFAALIENYKNSGKTNKITVGVSWILEPSFNFYRTKYKADFIPPITRETTNKAYDYYYIFTNFDNIGKIEDMQQIKTKYHLKILKHFEDTDSYLLAK
jgi:hypothetical protein